LYYFLLDYLMLSVSDFWQWWASFLA
jgi:hypothetical protein